MTDLFDFSVHHQPFGINRFPVSFTEVFVSGVGDLWLPAGISRKSKSKGWIVHLAHRSGLYLNSHEDGDSGPMGSLTAAWNDLKATMGASVSRYGHEKQAKSPGPARFDEIDTGVTGVLIGRYSKHVANGQGVHRMLSILVLQTLSSGAHRSVATYDLSETGFKKSPVEKRRVFEGALKEAVAIRRYYNEIRGDDRHPDQLIRYSDVPERIRQMPDTYRELDPLTLYESFTATPKGFSPVTTHGDPVALASELKSKDLRSPIKSCRLNGYYIKFRETKVEGQTFYLPTELFRARESWRLLIRHDDGVLIDQFDDYPGQTDPAETLQEAWHYLVSLWLETTTKKVRRNPIKNQLAWTGIEGASFLITKRQSRNSSREGNWRFQLIYLQRNEKREVHRITMAYWKADEINDSSLTKVLKHLAAIDSYRQALIRKNPSNADTILTLSTTIPREHWPAKPIIPITADDLFYLVESKRA